ncbi:MAG: response regulator [Methanoregula sp.]|jgi:DNA-binding NarL/FixJ family response regulator/DNA-binding PadR family transcriptional regulator|nr:response regulator [Methanoregula sp.]
MARVLIVDDEAIITMQLGEKISSMGHKVVGRASSGEDAIAKAHATKPDIVLMDIVMPGKTNGIAAAKVIHKELDIPVIFITSYADDKIIAEVKQVNPYGYIVKPFNELELKATIELALFRKENETSEPGKRGHQKGQVPYKAGDESGDTTEPDASFALESRTVLLNNFYQGLILVLYTPPQTNEAIYKMSIEYGLTNGHHIFFAYHQSRIPKYFNKEIQTGAIILHRLKQGELDRVIPALETHRAASRETGKPLRWQILMDFSHSEDLVQISAIKEYILKMMPEGSLVSGIIALNIEQLSREQIESVSAGITKVIVSTGDETSVSIANHSFPLESLSIVPQAVIEEIVRKSLEPLVLSILNRPLSGYDIVHEIHSRHNVLIPQSRIYTILYELERQGILEVKTSGKSKLYVPTERGAHYIRQKVNEFKYTFQHIFGGVALEGESIRSAK